MSLTQDTLDTRDTTQDGFEFMVDDSRVHIRFDDEVGRGATLEAALGELFQTLPAIHAVDSDGEYIVEDINGVAASGLTPAQARLRYIARQLDITWTEIALRVSSELSANSDSGAILTGELFDEEPTQVVQSISFDHLD